MPPGPQPQFDRQDVLLKAVELFWDRGYEGTGMAQLVEHLGIGRQSLYNTFGDKQSLYLEALAAYDRGFIQSMLDVLEAPGSPLGNVRKLTKRWEELANDRAFKGCMLASASAALGPEDERVAELLASSYERIERAFRDAFDRAVEAGELEPGTSTRDLARLFVNTGQGLAVLGHVKEPRFTKSVVRSLLSLLPSV